jgi:N-dimethylarginine dimethylaminohydrolase
MNIHAALAENPKPRYLMCRPQHFAVTYSINPWMDPKAWSDSGDALHATAVKQWAGLHRALTKSGATVEQVEPAPGLPDLVFTANAAVVLDGKALLARFRHAERQGEQPVYANAFRTLQSRGFIDDIVEMPENIALEGAGDCLWDALRGLFWTGYGFRSDRTASVIVEKTFGAGCVPLELADPSYYHLDTALSPLPCGGVIYHPGAFTAEARDTIEWLVAPCDRIALDPADAARFAANSVSFGRTLVLSSCSETLHRRLTERGYAVVKTPLASFLRSGGSACCLTLRLDYLSQQSVVPLAPVSVPRAIAGEAGQGAA